MTSSIFLSHNYLDKPFTRRLAKDLEQFNISVWIDEAEIQIGDSLIQKIREGIDNVDYLGVILSKNSVNSEWVKKEVDIAMNQEIKGKRVKVLPLVIDKCDLPWFLEGKLYADFTNEQNYPDEFRKLAKRLGITGEIKLSIEINRVKSSTVKTIADLEQHIFHRIYIGREFDCEKLFGLYCDIVFDRQFHIDPSSQFVIDLNTLSKNGLIDKEGENMTYRYNSYSISNMPIRLLPNRTGQDFLNEARSKYRI